MTIVQAAKAIGIGATSLRRIIAKGGLPVLRMTKKTLLLESDVEAFVAASRGMLIVNKPANERLPRLPLAVATSRHLR